MKNPIKHKTIITSQIIAISSAMAFCFLLLIMSTGCKVEDNRQPPEKTYEIQKEYKRGPVTFILRVSRKEITIADRLRLDFEVRAKEEYEVQLPEFGAKLEQFGIADYSSPPPQLIEDGVMLLKRSYVLEPFLSGEYKIPPMEIVFWGKNEKETEKHEIKSEELLIDVKSLLPEKTADLKIKPIAQPLELPGSKSRWLFPLIISLFLASGVTAAFVFWRKRKAINKTSAGKPAHEIAYEELEALLALKLIENGEIKLFYLKLSNILRYYIENRFGVRAPEMTTEEFLSHSRDTDMLIPTHKGLLREFLLHCDMVKFAEHAPTNNEIQKSFDACKQFIIETEIKEEKNHGVGGGMKADIRSEQV